MPFTAWKHTEINRQRDRKKYDSLNFFDQWPKLHLGLDALSNLKILKGVYWT